VLHGLLSSVAGIRYINGPIYFLCMCIFKVVRVGNCDRMSTPYRVNDIFLKKLFLVFLFFFFRCNLLSLIDTRLNSIR